MSDTPERSVEYKPEEGAEVRAAPRYNVSNVSPSAYEAIVRDVQEPTYQSLSLMALAAFVVAVVYCCMVSLGGIAAFWLNDWWLLLGGTIAVPLLSIPVALKFNIRDRFGLLRIAGLSLLGFYAVPVGVGGLNPYFSHTPWLLPLWTLVFPLAGVGLGLVARLRILSSEGTLTGKLLATWAIGLSAFFALSYLAFYTATYVAVRQQAVQFGDAWVELLQQDDVKSAFFHTIPPQYRTGGGEMMSRDELEGVNIRSKDDTGMGLFESFAQKPCVRLLTSSTQAKVEFLGVRDWSYENGGYRVDLSYRVTSPYWSFPLDLTVFGTDVKGDAKGKRKRDWVVQSESAALTHIEPQLTDKGKQLLALVPSSHDFAYNWLNKLANDQNQYGALDDTLSEDTRDPGAVRGAYAAPAGVGFGFRAVQGQASFFKGDLVKADEPTPQKNRRDDDKLFWSHSRVRRQIVEKMKKSFAPGSDKPKSMQLRDNTKVWPLWSEENGRLFYRADLDIVLAIVIPVSTPEGPKEETGLTKIEARLVMSCSPDALTTGNPQWRIEGLELIRGLRLEEPKQQGPGGPGGRQQPRQRPNPPRPQGK